MMKKIFLWMITVTGIAILVWVCNLVIESRDAVKWPQTKGHVISSSLLIKHLPQFIDANTDPTRWYGVDVQYEYYVGSAEYVSNRLSFDPWDTRSPKTALKVMNKYRHQHEVTVYYDPVNPQQAVLEPAHIGDIYIPLMVGVVLVFWGLVFLGEQSLEVKTYGVEHHLRLGNSYQKAGKFEEARREFNKIIEISSKLSQGYKSRGVLYLQEKKWDDAIADFNQTLLIDRTDASIYFNRANAYAGKMQFDKAWADMQKAMEMGFKVRPEILEDIKRGL